MLTENFTRALQLTHSFNPTSASSSERLEAERYLMQLRERPEGLNLSFHIISNEAVDEVRCFWAFNTIMYHLPALAAVVTTTSSGAPGNHDNSSSSSNSGANANSGGSVVVTSTPAVDDAQAEELYRTLFSFIYRYLFSPHQQQQQQQPPGVGLSTSPMITTSAATTAGGPSPISDFLINKHAQLMVVGLQCFYPNRWRCFFEDLFDLLTRSTGGSARPSNADAVAIYFLRVFEYIDERVVSVRERSLQERGKDMRARDMAVKDAMRGQVIPRLVQTWYNILSEVRHRAPDIAFLCLSVVQTYVEWIDVSLILTADWINLFYFAMTVPPTTLRVAACECILSLVAKKQLPGMKMELLRTLNIVASLPRIVSMLNVPPRNDEDLLLIDAVTRLVVAVAEQFLSLFDICTSASGNRPPSTVLIDAETGVNMADIPFDVTPELVNSLADAVHAVVAQLLRIYTIPGLPEVHEVCLPLLQTYLKSQVLLEHEAAEVLIVTFDHMRIDGIATHEEKVWEDGIIDHRKALFNIVRLLYRRFPSLVMQHLCAVVVGITEEHRGTSGGGDNRDGSGGGYGHHHSSEGGSGHKVAPGDSLAHVDFTHPEVVEAALHYVYEIGEAVKLETALKDGSHPVTEMIARLLTSDAVAVKQTNACVHLAFFECLERYHLFFLHHVGYIPVLLQRLLLLPCGVTNRNDRVRGRICNLFSRMLQMLKGAMRPYAADMAHAIMTIVNASHEANMRNSSGSGAGGVGGVGVLQPNDLREMYEAAGTLLALFLSSTGNQNSSHDSRGGCQGSSDGGSSSSGLPRQLMGGGGGGSDTSSWIENGSSSSNSSTATSGGGGAVGSTGYCVTLTESVIQGVLQQLERASSSSSSGIENAGGGGGGLDASIADAMSYLSALAKGISLSDILNSAGGSAHGVASSASATKAGSLAGSFVNSAIITALSGGADVAQQQQQQQQQQQAPSYQAALRLAQIFASVSEQPILQVLSSSWRSSPAVRDAGGQFFQQMINTIPFESIHAVYEAYVELTLSSMEAAPELSRLLRLMYQFVNKSGSKGVPTVVRVTPAAWTKVLSLGELDSAASPVVYLGVISESAREKTDVYRQFFSYVFSIAMWGCAPALLLMPEDCLSSMLSQLVEAVTLPVDLELPKAALQTLTKITGELFGPSSSQNNSSSSTAPSPSPPSKMELYLSQAGSAAAQQQMTRTAFLLQRALLDYVLPTVFRLVMRPPPPPMPTAPNSGGNSATTAADGAAAATAAAATTSWSEGNRSSGLYFDLSDGKSFLLLGEVGLLCKACCNTPFREDALQVMYSTLISGGRITEETAMRFCCAVRDQPRFNSMLKVQFKQMLEQAHQR